MAKGADVLAEEGHVQALYSFGYDEEHKLLDRGEVIVLGGHPGDARLLELRYLVRVMPGVQLSECGRCKRLFIDEYARERHGDIWHSATCPACETQVPKGVDRTEWVIEHRRRCDQIRLEKEAERLAHAKVVKEIKAGRPVEVVGA